MKTETELEIRARQRDYWQNVCMERLREINRLREALKQVHDARLDDDGKWIDQNGDYIDALTLQ